jgi:predicted metal-dependent HD superfamily phosphohydrolase
MDYTNITRKAEHFVLELFEKNKKQELEYHNLDHTRSVVKRSQEIAAHYELTEKDLAVLSIAGWFHDTGHLFVEPAMHEIKSNELMKKFFELQATETADMIPLIENCVLATRVPQAPKTLPEQIICDADTYHLGTKDFKSLNKQLKKEYISRKLVPTDINWNKQTLEFLEAHRYFTPYCKELLEEGKQKNLEKLRAKVLKTEMTPPSTPEPEKEKEKEKKEPLDAKEEKNNANLLNKGIQTMLRLTSDNHLELSGMADGKANILISVNAIIISVILSVLIRRLEVDTHLTIPTIIFLVFSLVTIVIAILATRPKISGGRFSKEDIMTKKTNLLFFGNFHKATLEEYEWGMREMMKDQDYLYGALIKDIYFLGVVLGRKYKLLRLAYSVFMVGIIISVLAFALAVILNRAIGGGGNSAAMPL